MNIKSEYRRIRKNLRNKLYRLRKKGVSTPSLPPIPKRITQGSIRRLEKMSSSLNSKKRSTRVVKPKKVDEPKDYATTVEMQPQTPAHESQVQQLTYEGLREKLFNMLDIVMMTERFGEAVSKGAKNAYSAWESKVGQEAAESSLLSIDWSQFEKTFYDSSDANYYCHYNGFLQELEHIGVDVSIIDYDDYSDDGYDEVDDSVMDFWY